VAYRKRYWIDSAGRFRDRRNHNRVSSGPKGKVDRREYGHFTVNTPETWQAPAPKRKPKRKPKPKAPVERAQDDGDKAPAAFPPLSTFNSPFRRFLTLLPKDKPRTLVTMYAILRKTDAKYIDERNTSGARVYAKQIGTMTRSRAARLTVGDVRRLYQFDRDGVLAVLALKGRAVTVSGTDPIRAEIAHEMNDYLRTLDKGTQEEAEKKLPKSLRTRKGRKLRPGGKTKRTRHTATR
jgi:hypothetical protein